MDAAFLLLSEGHLRSYMPAPLQFRVSVFESSIYSPLQLDI
uniref:Uncharacterized protein n=1 Tax=Siphoviridae sp. ctZZK17 TaxID=2826384 RepID=A0A8S5MNT7_9CAUD|nr:MAG TPA: hypothetical protein [Siphoviridae sp. ctZZK17]